MARTIIFGFGTKVEIGVSTGNVYCTRSGSVVISTELADTSSTCTGTKRQRDYGLSEAELTLNAQADAEQIPHAAPFSIGLRQTITGPIKIFVWGDTKPPITLRNVKCDRFAYNWDVPNPNTIEIHGFSGDFDDPGTTPAILAAEGEPEEAVSPMERTRPGRRPMTMEEMAQK